MKDRDLDALTKGKIENWDEWNFLARDISTSKGDFDLLVYDGERYRVQIENFERNPDLGDYFRDVLAYMKGDWDLINVEVDPPITDTEVDLNGRFYWEESDREILERSDFKTFSATLFGYNPLENDSERIEYEGRKNI